MGKLQNKRIRYFDEIADNLEKHFDELVKAESKDNGKPRILLWIFQAFYNIRFLGTSYNGSETHEMDSFNNYTLRPAVGVWLVFLLGIYPYIYLHGKLQIRRKSVVLKPSKLHL